MQAAHRRILDNLRGLFRMGGKVLIRMPLIPGLNDDPAGLEAAFAMLREEVAQGADIAGVDILPYHRYGEGKYRQLGRMPAVPSLTRKIVWAGSKPFLRIGARRNCLCGLSVPREGHPLPPMEAVARPCGTRRNDAKM